MNRRKEEQNISWNSFKIHLRDVDTKRQINQKTTSFGAELDQGEEGEGLNETHQGAGREAGDGLEGGSCSVN